MGKKKKKVKVTKILIPEGKRELKFYNALYDKFYDEGLNIHLNIEEPKGGTSTSILEKGISKKNNFDKVYVWFDEDKPLTKEIREQLGCAWSIPIKDEIKDCDLQSTYNQKNKNPILIVSKPQSVDGFLLELFGGNLPNPLTTENCKKNLTQFFKDSSLTEEDYYKSKPKEFFENTGLEVMDLLLSTFKK